MMNQLACVLKKELFSFLLATISWCSSQFFKSCAACKMRKRLLSAYWYQPIIDLWFLEEILKEKLESTCAHIVSLEARAILNHASKKCRLLLLSLLAKCFFSICLHVMRKKCTSDSAALRWLHRSTESWHAHS